MSRVLITGANRGIGYEFVKQYAKEQWSVLACCRDISGESSSKLNELCDQNDKINIEQMDMLNHETIDLVSQKYKNIPIDVIINNAGIIGPIPIQENLAAGHFGSINYDNWENVIKTNTFAPIKVVEAFIENIRLGNQKKIITLSSTVGSFQESTVPSFCYSTSKTAVTKAVQLLAEILKDEGIISMAFCPGHVMTRMGWSGATVKTEDSVKGMKSIIKQLNISDTASFRRYNGETIAW